MQGKSLSVTYKPFSEQSDICGKCVKEHPYGIYKIRHRGDAFEKELSDLIYNLRYGPDENMNLEHYNRMEQIFTYPRKEYVYKVIANDCNPDVTAKDIQAALDGDKKQ